MVFDCDTILIVISVFCKPNDVDYNYLLMKCCSEETPLLGCGASYILMTYP